MQLYQMRFCDKPDEWKILSKKKFYRKSEYWTSGKPGTLLVAFGMQEAVLCDLEEACLCFFPDSSPSPLTSSHLPLHPVGTPLHTICHLENAYSSNTAKSVILAAWYYHWTNENLVSAPPSSVRYCLQKLACISSHRRMPGKVLTRGPYCICIKRMIKLTY